MLKLINKKNGREVGEHIDDIEEILKKARQHSGRGQIEFYRERVGYNEYVIEIWTESPIKKGAVPEHIYDITGVKRKHLKVRPKLIGPVPREPKIIKPKPREPILSE